MNATSIPNAGPPRPAPRPATPDDMSDRYRAASGEQRAPGTVREAAHRLRTRRETPEQVARFLREFAERWWGVRS